LSTKITAYPGNEISSGDFETKKILYGDYQTDLRYSWAAGAAMGRFLSEMKAGRIMARKCNTCNRVLVPPRMFCEVDFKPTDSWVHVKDTGEVNTYSISHVAADASRVKEPFVIAVINIDGASKGMGFLHLIGEVKPESVKVGLKVKAVWKPRKQRIGSITDIRYFKPI
jgi:uncharacterized OB-fold protein